MQKIGKNEFPEATSILKERPTVIISGLNRDRFEQVNTHLAASASIDGEAWSSFPYRGFKDIVYEVNRKQRNASVMDNSSSTTDKTTAFLNTLKPCNRGEFYRCPSDLTFSSVKVLDVRTIEVYGAIDEDAGGFRYRKAGNFKMILSRKDQQLDKWLVQEMSRTENSASVQNSESNSNNSNNNLSTEDTLQELLKINKELSEAGLRGNKAIYV